MANALSIAAWLNEAGLVEIAGKIRSEFLTGTAITILVGDAKGTEHHQLPEPRDIAIANSTESSRPERAAAIKGKGRGARQQLQGSY